MDLLSFAKTIADRVEAAASRAVVPVAVCVIDTHGVGSSRVDLQACKLEYSIVSPK